jgi:Ser-tRNA(Ala) deacylase AlaX
MNIILAPRRGFLLKRSTEGLEMTELLYMKDFNITDCEATVVGVSEFEGKQVISLNQTCFYAKGGGQDFDQGSISSDGAVFTVEAVHFVDGEVKHIGSFEQGSFKVGDSVHCQVNQDRRQLNTRLHSAGHVLDMAVRQLGWDWIPGKGAHYPHMSFVEYSGQLDAENKDALIRSLQEKIDQLIQQGSTNSIRFITPEEMATLGAVVPKNLPKGKPSRAVLYDNFAVPCGGTHVENIKEIIKLVVTKMKMKDGNIRVSYSLES